MKIQQIYLFNAFESLDPSHQAFKNAFPFLLDFLPLIFSDNIQERCPKGPDFISEGRFPQRQEDDQSSCSPGGQSLLPEACVSARARVCVGGRVGGWDACECSNIYCLRWFCCVPPLACKIQVVLLYRDKGQTLVHFSSPSTSKPTQCQSPSDILNIHICVFALTEAGLSRNIMDMHLKRKSMNTSNNLNLRRRASIPFNTCSSKRNRREGKSTWQVEISNFSCRFY